MKFLFTTIAILALYFVNSQCNSASLLIEQTRAKDTDSNINWELKKHYSFFNPACSQRGILVVHLVGSFDNPSNNIVFPSHAANNGFHVVSLKYSNSVAAQSSCASSTNINCYSSFRQEIIEGGDYHPDINVDVNHSVYNRLIKLLQYLHTNNPNQGWNQYYNLNNINWSKIIISGHSQGGGHAAYIAKDKPVKRVLMFASPNDYSSNFNAPATWTTQSHITPDSLYYGFNNLYDDVVIFSNQFEIWNALGMPTQGDSLCVNINSNYFLSKQLYTTTTGPNNNQNHSLMIRDDQLILDGFGKSIFIDVWNYMLGITEGLGNELNDDFNFLKLYPNPVNTYLNINSSKNLNNYSLKISNIQGQILISMPYVKPYVNVNSLARGVYYLTITSKDKQQIKTIKFIKM